jgi:hypothetical protein
MEINLEKTMHRTFNLSKIGADIAFAFLAAFMAIWPQILTGWLAEFLSNLGFPIRYLTALVIMLVMAALLLFANFWTLRHHPSRFVPALKQHGRHEMKVLLQGGLFALAMFATQIQRNPIEDGLEFSHIFILFSALLLLFLGAFFRNELENDSEYLNNQVMDYVTDVLANNPRITQRIVEGYIRERQIGGLIPRGVLASLARMLLVQYFEQQNKYLHNTVVMLDSYHDPDNWKLLRVD